MKNINTNSNIAEQNMIETIFDIRDFHKDYTDEDILNEITNILDELKDDSMFVDKFEEALQNKRKELGYCPYCGEKLENKTYKEYHTEIAELGHIPYEELNDTYCSKCGYIDE